jgi:hypothetical protein
MVIDKLTQVGIRLDGYKIGEHRLICPQCSHLRRKKKDRCLTLRIENEHACWNCWHCGWRGGVGPGRSGLRQETRHQPRDFGASRRYVRYGILP